MKKTIKKNFFKVKKDEPNTQPLNTEGENNDDKTMNLDSDKPIIAPNKDNNEEKTSNNESFESNNEDFESNNENLGANNESLGTNKLFLNDEHFKGCDLHNFPPHVRKKIESEISNSKKINQNLCDKLNKLVNSFAIFNFTAKND